MSRRIGNHLFLLRGDVWTDKDFNPDKDKPVTIIRDSDVYHSLLARDAKIEPFVRSNLALVYSRALANKRVYEEALEALKSATPETVCDPAAYERLSAGRERGTGFFPLYRADVQGG